MPPEASTWGDAAVAERRYARGAWATIGGKTGVEIAELDEADRIADRLMEVVGLREQGPARATEVAELRQRTYTLFVQSYDAIRRAVCYLRWNEGDADSITPSLFAGRGGRRKAANEPEATAATPAAPATSTTAATSDLVPTVSLAGAAPSPLSDGSPVPTFEALNGSHPFLK